MYFPITGYVLMDTLIAVRSLVHHHRGDKTLYISAGEYELCATEWSSLTSLGTP